MGDLSTLSRGGGAAVGGGVPRPASRWKTRLLLPAAIAATAAGLLLYTAREALTPAAWVEVMPVVALAMEEQSPAGQQSSTMSVIVQAAGWIEPDPYAVNVSALAEGVVKEVLVLEGDSVEAGQVVARLVDDEARLGVASAEAEVASRQAELAMAEAELAAAEAEWANPVDRQRAISLAEAGAALARAELAKLPADLSVEEARLAELRDELARKAGLAETGAVSRGELARLQRRIEAQAAAAAALEAMRPVLESRVQLAEAELVAAREGMRLRVPEARRLAAARAGVEAARAGVARAERMRDESALRLERMEIRAPAAGVVLSRLASPGTRLAPGGGEGSLGEVVRGDSPSSGGYAVRLYDPGKLQVRVDVPLADAGRVSIGQPAEVTVEVLPSRVMRGRVTRVLSEANIQKNTLQVKVAIQDPDPRLRPEMLARVKLMGSGNGGSLAGGTEIPERISGARLFIPREALGEVSGTSARIWVADRQTRSARQREVTVGSAVRDGWVEVASGLRHGDLLIVGGQGRLRDGMRVRFDVAGPRMEQAASTGASHGR